MDSINFKLVAILLICVLEHLFAGSIHRSECRRDAIYKATYREKILTSNEGNVITTNTVLTLSECAKQCNSYNQSRSFNFKKEGSDNCQILNIDKSNSSARTDIAAGWIHYEPVSKIGPRCRLVSCAAGYRCIETCSNLNGYKCIDINECKSNPCQHEGACNNLINKYTCTCVPGYTGTNCETEINECDSSPCQNGATCNNLVNKYTCNCAPGYQGTNCETDINECSSTPCRNGATCNNYVNYFTCSCGAGYQGTLCETNINECSSGPCQNGGTCNDLVNGYSCSCTTGYGGTYCQTDTSCRPYSWLTESNRAVSYYDNSLSTLCDSTLTEGWYRFGSPAGTNMRTSPPSNFGTDYRCRTHAGGWLNGAHPSSSQGEVSRQVCFAWSGQTCWQTKDIKVLNCGSFYIYYLYPTSGCSLRYCGNY